MRPASIPILLIGCRRKAGSRARYRRQKRTCSQHAADVRQNCSRQSDQTASHGSHRCIAGYCLVGGRCCICRRHHRLKVGRAVSSNGAIIESVQSSCTGPDTETTRRIFPLICRLGYGISPKSAGGFLYFMRAQKTRDRRTQPFLTTFVGKPMLHHCWCSTAETLIRPRLRRHRRPRVPYMLECPARLDPHSPSPSPGRRWRRAIRT